MTSTTALPGTAAPRRRAGRPRAEGHDERIVQATAELIDSGEEVTVSRVVALSGVSRAAIYRRWPSMTDLVAAALDRGREPYVISLEGELLENVLAAFSDQSAAGTSFSEERFRMRLRLALSDRKLAQAYWRDHVDRRRGSMTAVLEEGIARGELRPDIDIDACIDLINGVYYYQYVVRGVAATDPAAMERCRAAVRIAWQGMTRNDV